MPTPDAPPAVTLLLAAHGSTCESLQRTLRAALSQRLVDCETVLLLPPDWSSGLPQLTEAMAARLRILPCPRAGLAAAWNLGLQHAAGEYLAFLSAGCEPTPGYALLLYAQALFEDAQLCHGEYALSSGNVQMCSDYGALAAQVGSALLCLGPLWTFLFARRFLAERQLRFGGACGDEAGLPFLVQALLDCRVMALCEGRVGACDSSEPAQLTADELERGLAACRAAAAALCARKGTQPAAVLAYALAWLLQAPLARLEERSAAAGADACRALAAQLQAACPQDLRQPLERQLGCWAEGRAAIRTPWYRTNVALSHPPDPTTGERLRHTRRQVLHELQAKVGPEHDDVYLLLRHLGDAYAVLCFITHLIRTSGSRSPVIAVCTQGLLELVAMTRPELPVVLLQPRELHDFFASFATPQLNLGRWRLFIHDTGYRIPQRLLIPMMQHGDADQPKLQTYAVHLYGCQVSAIDIPPLRLLQGARERALAAARRQGLATGRLVMIFPETYSAPQLSWEDFWLPLIRELLGRGCGIFVNLTRGQDCALPDGACSFELSVAEVTALAFEARRIIAQRCGLTELLCQGPAQLDVIYIRWSLAYATLLHMPHVNRDMLREYDLSAMSARRCLELLLARPEA